MKAICRHCWHPRAAGELGIHCEFLGTPFLRAFSQPSLVVGDPADPWAGSTAAGERH